MRVVLIDSLPPGAHVAAYVSANRISAVAQHMQAVMLQPEAERLVENLIPFKVKDVGSKRWMAQHEDLERLNVQAQQSILTQTDEFVVEAFTDLDKVRCVLRAALAQMWLLRAVLAASASGIRSRRHWRECV